MGKIGCSAVALLTFTGVACQQTASAPPPKVTVAPVVARPAPDLTPIVAQTGPLEFPDGDGYPAGKSLKEFQARVVAFKQKHIQSPLVLPEHLPPGLSPATHIDMNLPVGVANVSWVVDGDARHGYTLIYDENANGDLRDDPRHAFTADKDGFDVFIDTTTGSARTKQTLPLHMRFRVHGDHVYVNHAVLRRGTITVGGRARPFLLQWSATGFDSPSARIALDLDGDGTTKLSTWAEESPESFFVMERSLTVAGRGYDFKVAPHGDTLTLTPRTDVVPARPSLAVGTPAPELAGTDLDGQPVALSGLRGRTVLVDFWSTGCPPCREALPKLADLYRRRHAEGLDILSIILEDPDGPDATREEAMKLLGAKPYAGHEVIDLNNALLASYRTMLFPTYFIVDPAGKITCARCELGDVLSKLDRDLAPTPVTSGSTGL